MKTCENCGSKMFNLGCINCNEADYIEEQLNQDAKDEIPKPNNASLFRNWFVDTIGLDTYEKQNVFVTCRNEIEKLK